MVLRANRDIEYLDGRFYAEGTEFNIDVKKLEYVNTWGQKVLVQKDGASILVPSSYLSPKEPIDAETSLYLLDMLESIERHNKILFINSSLRRTALWDEANNFFVFSQREFEEFEDYPELRFQRNVFGSKIREATKELDLVIFEVGCPEFEKVELVKRSLDGNETLWSFDYNDIDEVFELFRTEA